MNNLKEYAQKHIIRDGDFAEVNSLKSAIILSMERPILYKDKVYLFGRVIIQYVDT